MNLLKIIDSIKSRFERFAPKKAHQWILHIDGIEPYSLKSAQRPTIEYINDGYIGNSKIINYQEMEFVIYDLEKSSSTREIYDWINVEPTSTRKAQLVLIDSLGNVVEQWNMELLLNFVAFGDLNYAQSSNIEITLKCKPVHLELV